MIVIRIQNLHSNQNILQIILICTQYDIPQTFVSSQPNRSIQHAVHTNKEKILAEYFFL